MKLICVIISSIYVSPILTYIYHHSNIAAHFFMVIALHQWMIPYKYSPIICLHYIIFLFISVFVTHLYVFRITSYHNQSWQLLKLVQQHISKNSCFNIKRKFENICNFFDSIQNSLVSIGLVITIEHFYNCDIPFVLIVNEEPTIAKIATFTA